MNERTILIKSLSQAKPHEDTESPAGTRPFQTRGVGDALSRGTAVAVDVVKNNMTKFVEDMNTILEQSVSVSGSLSIQQIEVHAEISATGDISILGSGVGIEGVTGIKFVFERPK